MWKVPEESLLIVLPEEFSLWEDQDFVYLFYKDKQVEVFNASYCNPVEIEREARKHIFSAT